MNYQSILNLPVFVLLFVVSNRLARAQDANSTICKNETNLASEKSERLLDVSAKELVFFYLLDFCKIIYKLKV